jgi:hypothetical protein
MTDSTTLISGLSPAAVFHQEPVDVPYMTSLARSTATLAALLEHVEQMLLHATGTDRWNVCCEVHDVLETAWCTAASNSLTGDEEHQAKAAVARITAGIESASAKLDLLDKEPDADQNNIDHARFELSLAACDLERVEDILNGRDFDADSGHKEGPSTYEPLDAYRAARGYA